MTKLLISLFLFFTVLFFGQNQLKVFSKADKKPVYNAAVYCEDELLGKTDLNGILSFKTKCRRVEILASNFQDVTADVKKSMEVAMQPLSEKMGTIDKVIIQDKSDPKALRILDEVNKRAKENSPKSLDSYNFKSYTKFSIDVDKDSVDIYKNFLAVRKDSLSKVDKKEVKQAKKDEKDSLTAEDFIQASAEGQIVSMGKGSRIQIFQNLRRKNQYYRQPDVRFQKSDLRSPGDQHFQSGPDPETAETGKQEAV